MKRILFVVLLVILAAISISGWIDIWRDHRVASPPPVAARPSGEQDAPTSRPERVGEPELVCAWKLKDGSYEFSVCPPMRHKLFTGEVRP